MTQSGLDSQELLAVRTLDTLKYISTWENFGMAKKSPFYHIFLWKF